VVMGIHCWPVLPSPLARVIYFGSEKSSRLFREIKKKNLRVHSIGGHIPKKVGVWDLNTATMPMLSWSDKIKSS
jgi:hypothetical protein